MSPQCWWSVQGGNIIEIFHIAMIHCDDYHSLWPTSHRECHRGPAVSSSRLVVFIGFILSYTEDWMSAACCCYGLAILLPQLEHQFLFFIGASDRVFRKLFHFKIVRNLLNIYHGIMCYCCFFCANTFARWELMKYPLKHLWIINSKKNWPWFSTQQIYGLEILFSKL